MLKIQHCLDNRLTDFGEGVSLTRRQRSTPQKHFLVLTATVQLEGLSNLKKCNYPIENQTRNLPACSINSQGLRLFEAIAIS
jgi:hypothetical protein